MRHPSYLVRLHADCQHLDDLPSFGFQRHLLTSWVGANQKRPDVLPKHSRPEDNNIQTDVVHQPRDAWLHGAVLHLALRILPGRLVVNLEPPYQVHISSKASHSHIPCLEQDWLGYLFLNTQRLHQGC